MRIPALIVGGFLGSGKTTFIIRSLLPKFKEKRIAILVNDFGKVNYDKIRLYQESMEVYGVEGGCFCCELGGELLSALAQIKRKEPEFLIVETSGLSDPSPIYYSLETSGYVVELIIGVFGLDMEDDVLKTALVQSQIDSAHCLVLTKADLLSNAQLREKLEFFHSYQKPLFLAKEGFVDEDIHKLFGTLKTPPALKGHHSVFDSITLHLDGYYSKQELESFLLNLPKGVYRVKGVVNCLESPLPLGLNYSFGYITWERLETEQKPFLVFIGQNLNKKIFEEFPKGGDLGIEHEKVCFPIEEFDAREGIAYIEGIAMDELDTAERLLNDLEEGDFLFIEEKRFKNFSEVNDLLKVCINSEKDKILFWKVPSGVVSYILSKLPKHKRVYHLSSHYLLPKAYLSLRLDTPEKESFVLSCYNNTKI
jgi:Putative GTPases (G3E family)